MKTSWTARTYLVAFLVVVGLSSGAMVQQARAMTGGECEYDEVKDDCIDLSCAKVFPGHQCRKTNPPDVYCACVDLNPN